MVNPEFDKLRFRYEYCGESLEDICYTESIILENLVMYANSQNWTVQHDPKADDYKDIDKFYAHIRKHLTVKVTGRAVSVWERIIEIENNLLECAELASTQLLSDMTSDELAEPPINDLAKLTKIVESLRAGHPMLTEAAMVPAIVDRLNQEGSAEESFEEKARKIRNAVSDIESFTTGKPKE